MKKPSISLFVNLGGTALAVWIMIALVATIRTNYALQRQIDTLTSQMALLQAQRDSLSDNIAYYKSASFQDREARERLNLQAPGENVIILPTPKPTPTPGSDTRPAARTGSNLRQWINFLSGKS